MAVWQCNQHCVVALWNAFRSSGKHNNKGGATDYLMELISLIKNSNKHIATECIESNADLMNTLLLQLGFLATEVCLYLLVSCRMTENIRDANFEKLPKQVFLNFLKQLSGGEECDLIIGERCNLLILQVKCSQIFNLY